MREHIAVDIDCNESAPITTREKQAALFERSGECAHAIGMFPAILHGGFEFARIDARAFRCCHSSKREVARIAELRAFKALRHRPAIFEIELFPDFMQLVLEERQFLRRHGFRIDARPDRMTVTTAFLFMEDDDARLTGEANRSSISDSAFSNVFDAHRFMRGRTERHREEILLALRPARERIGFIHRAHDRVGDKPRHFMNLDMLVLFSLEQMKLQADDHRCAWRL
jgi:hypothetical protein